MGCLKCGKETKENQVFCHGCLAVMEGYPIKAGAVIHLPHREPRTTEKKAQPAHKKEPMDQLVQLRRTTHWLMATIAVLSVLLCLCAGMLLQLLSKNDQPPVIGRNYTTSQSDNP